MTLRFRRTTQSSKLCQRKRSKPSTIKGGAMSMANPLVDVLEPDFNGGLLNPLLRWAGNTLPEKLTADSPASVLHRVVTADNRTTESLGAIYGSWMSGRMKAHAPYFALCGLLAAAWLLACCCLLAATIRQERRRRARLLADAVDAVDAAAASPSRYHRFYSMVVRRYRRSRRPRQQQESSGKRNKASGGSPNIDSVSSVGGSQDSSSGLGFDCPDSRPVRASNLSTKVLSGRDRRLLGQASASAIVGLVCAAFLVAYFTQAGSLVAFTSTAQSSRGIRTIVVATVGHLDRFLNRSLVESNRTMISMFERSYPPIERLFLDFGEELLDRLMTDYKIDRLIGQLEAFLKTINATMVAMRDIAGARATVIKPLQQFSAQLQVHREGLQDPLAEMCRQHGHLLPDGECHSLLDRLPDLRLEINDTKLETDSSVTMVTLLNKMLKLDIDNVQRQVQKAKDSLSTGLRAISGVVRQLLSSLIDAVSSQFAQAELEIARVNAGFDQVASNPQLWGAVEAAGGAVLALVIISCLVFVLTCALGGVLLWALLRYLRTACRLDRYDGTDNSLSSGTTPSKKSFPNSSPQRSSSNTSGFSSAGGARGPSIPQWRLSQSPQPPPLPQSNGFSGGWLDVELDSPDGDLSSPGGISEWQSQMKRHEQEQQQQKLNRLVAKEWNGFNYCCSFDCSLALLVGAVLTLLPLLFGLAFFYASGEAQVDACRYLATEAGNQRWDAMIDEFAGERLWPLVREALSGRPDLPICVPQFPERVLRAVRTDCADANRTLFSIFGLTGLLNATALLNANATRKRFLEGADLVKDQINATDANSLIPPELNSLTSVLPQMAAVLDAEDYAGSIAELAKPLLAMPGQSVVAYVDAVDRAAATVQRAEPGNSDAAIVRHTVGQLNASLARSAGLRGGLDALSLRYHLLQESRNVTNMTVGLLAALDNVLQVLADKPKMLQKVDERFLPTLERHLPRFADFLDPLAVDLLNSVGHCDDLHLALETLAVDLCTEAVPRANVAAFLLLLTVGFFAAMFGLCWWLLVRVGRHQAAMAQFQISASPARAPAAPASPSLSPGEPLRLAPHHLPPPPPSLPLSDLPSAPPPLPPSVPGRSSTSSAPYSPPPPPPLLQRPQPPPKRRRFLESLV